MSPFGRSPHPLLKRVTPFMDGPKKKFVKSKYNIYLNFLVHVWQFLPIWPHIFSNVVGIRHQSKTFHHKPNIYFYLPEKKNREIKIKFCKIENFVKTNYYLMNSFDMIPQNIFSRKSHMTF